MWPQAKCELSITRFKEILKNCPVHPKTRNERLDNFLLKSETVLFQQREPTTMKRSRGNTEKNGARDSDSEGEFEEFAAASQQCVDKPPEKKRQKTKAMKERDERASTSSTRSREVPPSQRSTGPYEHTQSPPRTGSMDRSVLDEEGREALGIIERAAADARPPGPIQE